jgi:hypothetical protein
MRPNHAALLFQQSVDRPRPEGYNSILCHHQIKGKGNYTLKDLQIFLLRAFVGLFIAVFLTRMFYGAVEPVYVAGLAAILVGLAYFAEYLRKRKER